VRFGALYLVSEVQNGLFFFFFFESTVITTNLNKKMFCSEELQGGCQRHSLGPAICIYM
jgi:hypothetical protein